MSKNLKKKVMWSSIEPITDQKSLLNLIFDDFSVTGPDGPVAKNY